MQGQDRYEQLLRALETEFPGFRVVKKSESLLQQLIHGALVLFTAGQMRAYKSGYQTTIRRTVYTTDDWESRSWDQRYITMRHEAVHLRQFKRWSLPGMALLYVLIPLPLGLAYFRAAFEREAYAETLVATAEVHGLDAASDPHLREHIISQFTGPSYGWMWPFRSSLERWYDGILDFIRSKDSPQ